MGREVQHYSAERDETSAFIHVTGRFIFSTPCILIVLGTELVGLTQMKLIAMTDDEG